MIKAETSSLCPIIPNTGFISENSEVLDKRHGKFTAHQAWHATAYMLVRWCSGLLPFRSPAAADWLLYSASMKLRLKDALIAKWCILTYLWKHCGVSWNEARRGHAFTQTYAALGVTAVSTLHTSSSCTKGWIEHITLFVLPTVCQKIVFCSSKIQNSTMFSSESSMRREYIHSYIPRSWSKS